MTTRDYLAQIVIPAALRLLPSQMDTPEARAMLLAIFAQESNCQHRRQVGGPARGFAQFEIAGIRGVLTHPLSAPHLTAALATLSVPVEATAVYMAVEANDILAAICARLLLWTDPDPLPAKANAWRGWDIYARTWRPGKPRRETWDAHFAAAWETIDAPLVSAVPRA